MPYEDTDIAKMRAEMMRKAQDLPYDDGAYLLGQNPDLIQVALFGRAPKPTKPVVPPVDVQRRSILGLKPQEPSSANVPAIRSSDVPVPSAVPQAPASTPTPAPTQSTAAPLTELANKALNAPISRREVLKKTGQVALNQTLPTPKVADVIPEVVPEIVSPLTQAAASGVVANPIIDKYLRDYVSNMFSEATANEPLAASMSMYNFIRDYLVGRVPEEELKKYDKIKQQAQQFFDEDDEYSDEALDAQSALEGFVHDKLKLLRADELYQANSELIQDYVTPKQLFEYISETSGGSGLGDDRIVGEEAFIDYINKMTGQVDD
jgi:hypothetical protein